MNPAPLLRLCALTLAALAFYSPVALPAADAPAPAPATPAAPAASSADSPAPPAAPVNTAVVPAPRPGGWMARHDGFVELAKKGDIDVLLLGDSITDAWRNAGPRGGREVWEANFPGVKMANFGISADRTQHVLWRLQNGEGQGFSPKVVMLLIGTNNTGNESSSNPTPRNTAAEAAAGVVAVVQEVRKCFPDAKILLLAIFPRGNPADPQRAQIAEINQTLVRLNDLNHVFYLDIGDKFLAPDGTLPPDVMPDKLHPNAKGYEIWAATVKAPISNLLK